jgi:hypothetical protein
LLLGNQVVVTMYGGQIHAFDYGTRQEIWTLPSKAFNEPAITPSGSYAAVMADNQCAILATKTGEQIGSIPVTSPGAVSLGFSSDGLRLALAQGNQVRVFDVASGEEQLLHEANVPLGGLGKPILWLEDDSLLLPTGVLLNLERNLIVWKYNLDQDAMEYTDLGHHGLLTFRGGNSTTIIRIPHDAAREAADRDTSGITAVKAGDSIAVVANASGPGVSRNDLRQWLGKSIENSGYRDAPSAPTQLARQYHPWRNQDGELSHHRPRIRLGGCHFHALHQQGRDQTERHHALATEQAERPAVHDLRRQDAATSREGERAAQCQLFQEHPASATDPETGVPERLRQQPCLRHRHCRSVRDCALCPSRALFEVSLFAVLEA